MSTQGFAAEALKSAPREAPVPASRSPRTRTSRVWGSISLALALLVVVVVFALQNLNDVEVRFFSMHSELPLAVLLLLVAVLGALIVFAFGAARIFQLRLRARRVRPRRVRPEPSGAGD